MILFTHTVTPRLIYIANFILKEAGVAPFHITTNTEEFRQYDGPRINYSDSRIIADEIWIKPHALLFEKNIQPQKTDCYSIKGNTAFFLTEGDFPFDIFSASFYLLSRYEEYLPHTKDSLGRYAHENSLAFQQQFLNQPLVNKWIQQFQHLLKRKWPLLIINYSLFSFQPTYDIDEAYAYKHKSTFRTTGAIVKGLLKGNWQAASERIKVLRGKMNDPYDSYGWMDELHERFELNAHYFFLVAERTGKYDRNILPGEQALQQLIQKHACRYSVGVHPSWQSGDDPSLIKKEKNAVEKAAGITITASRQHFIRLTLPQTFRHLIGAGITTDFSMGYGSINGFRASVASAFYWYDLEEEKATDLLLYPFCFMEANSFYEQKLSPSEALEEMRHYYREVKAVNGTLITLWHNTFLGCSKLFAGWREAYRQFVEELTE